MRSSVPMPRRPPRASVSPRAINASRSGTRSRSCMRAGRPHGTRGSTISAAPSRSARATSTSSTRSPRRPFAASIWQEPASPGWRDTFARPGSAGCSPWYGPRTAPDSGRWRRWATGAADGYASSGSVAGGASSRLAFADDIGGASRRFPRESLPLGTRERGGEEPQVERSRCAGRQPVRGQHPVEAEGAASIREVLTPEAPEAEMMLVVHHRFRRVGESAARPGPAMTELAVLASGAWEACIEAAPGSEELGRHRQIVRREEGVLAVRGVPAGEVVDEELGRRRVRILGQRVHGAPSDGTVGRIDDPRGHGPEPAGIRPTVVVGEGEELATRPRGARVARGGGTGMGLGQQHDIQGGAGAWQLDGAAAVIHDDGFKPVARIVETCDRVEAPRKDGRASIGGHHDRETRKHDQWPRSWIGFTAHAATKAPVR